MTKSMFYFYIGVVTGSIPCIIFMIRQIYLIVQKGGIERRSGLKPITPHDYPAFYWSFVGFSILSAIGIMWGITVVILRLLNA